MSTKNKEATRTASDVQEERVAHKLNGYKICNSGAGTWKKGDIHLPDASMLVECKTCMTPKESFSIKKEWIVKNKSEAFSNRLSNTAIAFSFCFDDKEDYYVIDDKLMKFLVEKLIEENKVS